MLYVRVQRKLEPRSHLYRLWVWLQFIDKHHYPPHMECPPELFGLLPGYCKELDKLWWILQISLKNLTGVFTIVSLRTRVMFMFIAYISTCYCKPFEVQRSSALGKDRSFYRYWVLEILTNLTELQTKNQVTFWWNIHSQFRHFIPTTLYRSNFSLS